MANNNVPLELIERCLDARETMSYREIYKNIFHKEHPGCTERSFLRYMSRWASRSRTAIDPTESLELGTVDGFLANAATIQIGSNGELRQAWIKQKKRENLDGLVSAIQQEIKPADVKPYQGKTDSSLLEIPLFDLHFGVAKLSDYKPHLARLISIIQSKKWEKICIIMGQDLIHTNDMRGHTAKGTFIGEIDFEQAWKDAFSFWFKLIEECLENAGKVELLYSKGNHDETTGWCFFKAIEQRFNGKFSKIDDSQEPIKCIYWRGCMIGYGHCEYTNKKGDLFRNFTFKFPREFASSSVREIHTGHLHHESEDNVFMVRRLSSGVPTDAWSKNNGYIGSHKRFQVFEYTPGWLECVHYI